MILNGYRWKTLYDCRRGLIGGYERVSDPPEKAWDIGPISARAPAVEYYLKLCPMITGEPPYHPIE
jgi:hypothetical protein